MLDSNAIFDRCSQINELINRREESAARSMVIDLLDKLNRDGIPYTPMVNYFVRAVGLFPYIDKETASWQERAVVEAFKADVGGNEPVTLHSAQSRVLKQLLAGQSIAVSAPTSFGKSFIIDAFISLRRPNNVVIIVPTIALADETRRRIEHKFSQFYKIITTTDATLTERNIFIFPQERSFAYIGKLEQIDMLIVDEFYKASSMFDDARCSSLLSAMIELGKISSQRYYLAPNINKIVDNVFTQGMHFMRLTDFKTVITKQKKLFEFRKPDEDKNEFKKAQLVKILNGSKSKTLVYAGSYTQIEAVSSTLIPVLPVKDSQTLRNFKEWLDFNYGTSFSLSKLCERGVGVHNGRMHRSLSQIQVKLFEADDGIDTMVSTSSIIEGVNTQAEQVIVWSNKNGSNKYDYFTYRNIIGRAGRMFKYFVGKVYLLEEPPAQENTTLQIEFTEDVVETLDKENPGVEINPEQTAKIMEYENFMIEALGAEKFNSIRKQSVLRSCDTRIVKAIIAKLKENPEWPNGFDALAKTNSFNWRTPILDIIPILPDGNQRLASYAVWKSVNNWHQTMASMLEEYNEKGCGITIEDMFAAERYLSYNLCSVLSVIALLRKTMNPHTPDISIFLGRASNAFLPKLVYQLEEYGLPRSISRKVQDSNIINLENDEMEIASIIAQFKEVGMEKLLNGIQNLMPFEEYIIKYFYEGIS